MAQPTTDDQAQTKAVALLERVGALRRGEFTLSSGRKSDYYFDSKELTLDPEGAKFVAEQFVRKLDEEGIEYVGGTPYSGIPIVSHICLYSFIYGRRPIRAFYVREESKTHGLRKLVEGKMSPQGAKVAIVDDVVTTGKSLLDTIEKAKQAGYKIRDVIALIDRNEGGREAVEAKGYKFWALFTVSRTHEGNLDIRFNGNYILD